MFITKFGHSCLLVEESGVRILFDPGSYSTLQNDAKNLDVILVTHEHGDHLDFKSLEIILANNPQVKIYTNKGVGKKLAEKNIAFELLEQGQSITVKGVLIEGMGEKHSFIYSTLPTVDNVGYFIANRFFNPGDHLTSPGKPVEILACPIAGPWLNLAEVLDYVKAVKPQVVFPVHDGFLTKTNPYYPHAKREFEVIGSEWIVPEAGQVLEF